MKRYLGFVALAISVTALVTWRILDIARGGGEFERDPVGEVLLALAFLAFPALGSVIVFRQPENAMGWIFSGIGALVGLGGSAQVYAETVLPGATSPGAVGYLAAWVANWWWYPLLGLVMVFTIHLFPTGKPLSPRWRIPFLIGAASMVIVTFIAMTAPRLASTDVKGEYLYDLENPVGVGGLDDAEEGLVGSVLFGLLLVSVVIGVVSLIVRFKRSRGVERQQLKWFAFGAVLLPTMLLLQDVFGFLGDSNVPFALAVSVLPITAGLAVLRYRLYDIDVVINRALVYGTLTAILGGVYVGIIFGLQAMLAPVAADSDFAVAGSTLAVAALFRPVRARVQGFIDHRFYRRKVDAQLTVEGFSAHLRDEVELRAVSEQLVDVVRDTMQPAHVSLWLRAG